MSSMLRTSTLALVAFMAVMSVPARCQDGSEFDRARQALISTQRGSMAQAIDRWQMLSATDRFGFSDYASFLLAYPGFPSEEKLRTNAERALERESADPSRVIAFFDRFPPLTNPARARYALALSAMQRPQAQGTALLAWRGGEMSDASEASILSLYGRTFNPADHDARMNALLWAGNAVQGARQIAYVSPGERPAFMARLAMVQGSEPSSIGLPVPSNALRDTGYVYNRVRQSRRTGSLYSAINVLATRPPANNRALDPEKWVGELLSAAKGADASSAVRIAASADDSLPGADQIRELSFRLRDDYTSLMWLGGTKALWSLGDGARAAPLFYRYGAAAQTPQTRSKGFYWAGRALARGGDMGGANRYYEMAAAYPDHYYGMLALERLGRQMPRFEDTPNQQPTQAERAAFMARPITAAVREATRSPDWRVTRLFFKEISEQAQSVNDHLLVAELANSIGRRDLAVILGQEAHVSGIGNFQKVSFPTMPTPSGTNWTMVHAITRQESQFAQNAVSHAGARGLMQLMPGTAREQAGKIGMSYDMTALMSDPQYNLRLGDGYFGRMMDYFGGSYPLAVAAYNAGPGNVNKWLRANGDPRTGSVDWIDWVERIPIYETRNYVQRVLENAVVYEAMNPDKARNRGPNPLSLFLGKRTPG
ncbi:MAG TPA: lytic transglycosylase domain-containing protein [Novosphingobium sp.]